MQTISTRRILIQDLKELQSMSKSTFLDTYGSQNTEENMTDYLSTYFSVDRLTRDLIDKDCEFYFALSDDTKVGYVKINFGEAQTELKDRNTAEIERIYVLKEFKGLGIGRRLFLQALSASKSRGVTFLWLGVWDQNQDAIEFYKKQGFEAFDEHSFRLGDEDQRDIMMKIDL